MKSKYRNREGQPGQDREARAASPPADPRMFTVRSGLSVEHNGWVYRWGDLVQGDHAARLANRACFVQAPQSVIDEESKPAPTPAPVAPAAPAPADAPTTTPDTDSKDG